MKKYNYLPIIICVVWLVITWGYSFQFPRVFDDFKNLIFYLFAGIFFVVSLYRNRKECFVEDIDNATKTMTLGTCQKKFQVNLLGKLLIFYFAICLCSIAFNSARYEGLLELARLILWCGFIWSLSQLTKSQLLLIGKCSMISTLLIVILTIVARTQHDLSSSMYSIGHISYYGFFMAMHLPLAGFFIFSSRGKYRIFWSACFLLLMFGMFLSGARTSLIGSLAGLVAFFALAVYADVVSGKKMWKLFGICLLVPIVLVLFDSTKLIDRKIFYYLSFHKSAHVEKEFLPKRMYGYSKTIEMIRDRPTGWGLGSYRFVYPEYGKESGLAIGWYYHPHNEILHQVAEVGIHGMLMWLAVIGCLLGYGIKRLRSMTLMAILALTGLTIALVMWQCDRSYLMALPRMITGLYAGMLLREVK